MKSLAPIILFVYNRPWHTLQTLESLSKNTLAKDSILYIYSDAAKEESQIEKVNEVREVIKSKHWCLEVKIIERQTNFGLASNVIKGITEIVNQYGKIIVLEDDLITSPYFLKYCNDGLELYNDSRNIFSINGFQFPLELGEFSTFLSPLATSSWGWASWANKWAAFEELPLKNEKKIIQENRFLRARFNFGDYNYADMLNNTNSWAIRWYLSVFKQSGLGVFPTKSLVQNIGFDGSGENCGIEELNQKIYSSPITFSKHNVIDINKFGEMLNYFENKNVKSSNIINLKAFFKSFLRCLLL